MSDPTDGKMKCSFRWLLSPPSLQFVAFCVPFAASLSDSSVVTCGGRKGASTAARDLVRPFQNNYPRPTNPAA